LSKSIKKYYFRYQKLVPNAYLESVWK